MKRSFSKAFEYSDCWVEDSRLVVLSARDAKARGAVICPYTKVMSATRSDDHWRVEIKDMQSGEVTFCRARALVNAAGPWTSQVLHPRGADDLAKNVRLVRGSHIVVPKLFDHDRSYFFQGKDGRIIFAIPYETDFTLIGTTDKDHSNPQEKPKCTPEEVQYLLNFASEYFEQPLRAEDIVWSYSGVRSLFDDGASSAQSATRDYVLKLDDGLGPPVVDIFGGKITTHRKLAEAVLAKLQPHFPNFSGDWTAGIALPGGDFVPDGVDELTDRLLADYAFLTLRWARRLIRAYGTESWRVLGAAKTAADLGKDFGATLTESEVRWLIDHEFAATAEDVIWRRSKLGLRLSEPEAVVLANWMKENSAVSV